MPNNNAIIALIVLLVVLGGFLYFANREDGSFFPIAGNNNATTTDEEDEDTDEDGDNGATTDNTLLSSGAAISAKMVLAARLGVNPMDVEIKSVERMEWSDGCLGLPKMGEMCTQAIVPGYRVILEVEGQEYVYRTDTFGTKVRLDQ